MLEKRIIQCYDFSGYNYGGAQMKLGFGLMRLPRKGIVIDIPQTCEMVDLFLDAGGTYFDTAYIYPGSEDAIRKALCERHPRESYTLATKLNAGIALTEKLAKTQLATSLKRTGAGYIDYYLLHTIMEKNVQRYEKFDLWDFVREEKEAGRIRHYGFSFHGTPPLLEKLLQEHPDAEFVQLQINYCDWEDEKVCSREIYEIARRYGKPIVVMEPVKGGRLADPPENVRQLLTQADPNASFASWAIRFAASLDGVMSVLSGMSNVEQMKDNLSYMRDFKPLNDAERELMRKAAEAFHAVKSIPCTGCGYCVKGCPKGIPIPEIFAARNEQLLYGRFEAGAQMYRDAVADKACAADCIACGGCERACPQHIEIIDTLKSCANTFK